MKKYHDITTIDVKAEIVTKYRVVADVLRGNKVRY